MGEMKHTYIDRLNAFNNYCRSETVPGMAQLLYFKLLGVLNEQRWPGSVRLSNRAVMRLLCIKTETTLISVREALIKTGCLIFNSGSAKGASLYSINEEWVEKYSKKWSASNDRSMNTPENQGMNTPKNRSLYKNEEDDIKRLPYRYNYGRKGGRS